MQTWEYTWITDSRDDLNEHGAQGWEAVAVVDGAVLMKRPLA